MEKDVQLLKYVSALAESTVQDGSYNCKLCQISFDSGHNAMKHMNTHHGEGDWTCNECSFQSDQKIYFKKHVDEIHMNVFCCVVCDFKAVTRAESLKHKQQHEVKVGVKCVQCDQEFIGDSEFEKHLKQSHTKVNQCDKCHFSTTIESEYSLHLKTHLNEDKDFEVESGNNIGVSEPELPMDCLYQCNQCDYEVSNQYMLNLHKVGHTSSAIKCDKCDELFPDNNSIRKHKADIHRSHKPCRNYASNGCTYGDFCIFSHKPIPEGKFLCYNCGENFDDKRYLMEHRKKIHGNVGQCRNFINKFSSDSCWWLHEEHYVKRSQVFQQDPDKLAPPQKNNHPVINNLEQLAEQVQYLTRVVKEAGLLM